MATDIAMLLFPFSNDIIKPPDNDATITAINLLKSKLMDDWLKITWVCLILSTEGGITGSGKNISANDAIATIITIIIITLNMPVKIDFIIAVLK
ncbi:hypothetical protein BDD43_4898 [Mucilaginibacter gracilis]|uniref:Uncharacterized protein n=1 Tax=Mucilaginibacter gracilis TaxID=423350 RepID=A0A495J6N5_9SPHI|nr:hypothetical protein [Mucilaginibacter gracilis]RKR84650.1 hypothetical protein BDD43_4898 [Mucilaginibacter gracilis]